VTTALSGVRSREHDFMDDELIVAHDVTSPAKSTQPDKLNLFRLVARR